VISPTEQRLLNRAQQELGLEAPEAEEILRVVAAAYQQHQINLEEYCQALIDELAGQDELRADQRVLLRQLQAELKISDPDADLIEQKVRAEWALERQLEQEKADSQAQALAQQKQAAVEHEQNLQRFCSELKRAVAIGYPFHEQVEAGLRSVQQNLNLTDVDVAPIKAAVLVPAGAAYKEQIRLQAEQQQQAQETERKRQQQEEKFQSKSRSLNDTGNLKDNNSEIHSSKGVDYTDLKKLIISKKWKIADQVTTLKLLKASNAIIKGYFDEESIQCIPLEDLIIVNNLWKTYSANRLGFSAQRRIFDEQNGDLGKFGQSIGWRGKTMWNWKAYRELDFSAFPPYGQFPTLKNQERGLKDRNHMDNPSGGAGIDCFPFLYNLIKKIEM
jgi:hypothetical protein